MGRFPCSITDTDAAPPGEQRGTKMPRVPSADLTTNVLEKQVIGNKADKAVGVPSDTASILAYLKHLVGTAAMGLPPVSGPTYWVDYDLGADTNSGYSPQAPLKLLSAAITAVLAYQAAATNIYTRCRIFLVGSSTPQPAITVLPNYCDIIGIGASPLGDGYGIARIGSGITAAGVTITATKRGLYFKNIQFLGAGGLDAFLCDTGGSLLRSVFEDCAFGDASNTVSSINAGFKNTATCAGTIFRRCRFGLRNSAYRPVYGIYAGGQFSQNLIEDCDIHGATAGLYLHTSILASATIVKNNFIGPDVPNEPCAKGIDDNSGTGIIISGNNIIATDGIEVTTGAADGTVGNIVNEGTAGSRVAKTEGNLLVRTT